MPKASTPFPERKSVLFIIDMLSSIPDSYFAKSAIKEELDYSGLAVAINFCALFPLNYCKSQNARSECIRFVIKLKKAFV